MPSGVASAAHFLGHGLDAQPSQEQISTFCKQYPGLIDSPNYSDKDKQQYKKLYQQHCNRPAAAPVKPAQPLEPAIRPGTKTEIRQSRIDRIQPPACLARGSEIHVRGENLRDGRLDCRLEAGGQRQSLQAYSRTAREYRFRLSDLQPGPDYMLQCDVDGDRERISLQGCTAPDTPAQAADVDLAAEIRAGALRPGETQMVEVLIPNRGRSRAPQNQRYRVLLALVDRDLTRTAGMAMGGRGTLVDKRQWLTRVPAGGQSERVSLSMNIPGLLPAGQTLHWCAFADVDRQISEANRRNNLACVPASGGQQTVARDDLSELFGSAVRNRAPGVPDEDRIVGEGDSSPAPRTMMYEGDGGQSGIATAAVQVDLAEQPALPDVPDFVSGRPDLAVTGFRLASWGSCDPDEYTMFTFEVMVENKGTAPAAAPRINAADMHEGHNWGNGTVLGDAPLWPGESRTGSIIVGTDGEPTAHMMDAAPHPFMAMVNAGNAAGETDVLNNYYATLINVDPRPLCGSTIAGEAPEGIHETATLDGLGLDPAALEARVADLPAVQRDNEALPGIEAGALGNRGLGPRADAIEQANQARGLKEMSELARSGLAVPGFEGGGGDPLKPGGFDIANRDTGNPLDSLYDRSGRDDSGGPFGSHPYMPEGTAPRNREGETPNAGKGAGWLVPSMNPRDWAGGVSSQDGGGGSNRAAVFKTPDGTVEKRYMQEDGTVVVDTNHGGDGEFTRSTREERNPNRTRTYTNDAMREDGSGYRSQTTYNQRGNPIYARQTVFGPGRTVESDMSNDQPGNSYTWRPGPLHPDRTQDPNAPGYSEEFARWHSQFDHSKKQGAPVIDQVNPGPEGATPNPTGPRLRVPEHQLVGNPSPETLSGDERQARHSREQLLEKIRGPGGHPGDDDGDLEVPGN